MTEAVNKSIKINEHIYAPIPIAIEPIIIKYLLGLNLEESTKEGIYVERISFAVQQKLTQH